MPNANRSEPLPNKERTMSNLNIELLKKVRDKIASTPEAYDQSVYGRVSKEAPCGTAACIAGWTVLLADAMPITEVHR